MKRFFSKRLSPDMRRPIIYMTFTRFLIALCAALLLNEFVPLAKPASMRAYACAFFAVLFAGGAWIAYLRLDGVKLPKLLMKRVNIRKKPSRTYGDISDYVDEDVVSFDELDDKEKDVCCLIADIICCIFFTLISLL